MPQFSASLQFLWPTLAIAGSIHAAKAAGFDAVECHWPYDQDAQEIATALTESGMTMLGINTIPGENFGLSALPDQVPEARAAINQALEFADQIDTPNIHVMAGKVDDRVAAAQVFEDNLLYACERASALGKTILIEPLNPYDAPGYFLNSTGQAAAIIERLAQPNLKLMFDCYHIQRKEGDLTGKLEALLPIIGHIQFAGVPHRAEPSPGEVDYDFIFNFIDELGYQGFVGAEYKPKTTAEAGLSWLHKAMPAAL